MSYTERSFRNERYVSDSLYNACVAGDSVEIDEDAIQTLPDAIIEMVRPPARPIYAGARQANRAATAQAMNHNAYCISEISQVKTGNLITWADGHDKFSFVITLGHQKWSKPLHFVKATDVNERRNTVTWGYYAPTSLSWTNKSIRYVGHKKARAHGAFKFVDTRQVCAFNPSQIIIGWDLSSGERQNEIPNVQYLRLQQQIRAISAAQVAEGVESGDDDDEAFEEEETQIADTQ